MIELFFVGNPIIMGIMTLVFIGLFLAAWKAPAWVKEIGLIALMLGLIMPLWYIMKAMDVFEIASGVASPYIIIAGVKSTVIPIIWGIFIYIASLIIRIVQKPRI